MPIRLSLLVTGWLMIPNIIIEKAAYILVRLPFQAIQNTVQVRVQGSRAEV